MMKTIIYYRKSTDRDDKQANSLEHQLENCLRVCEKYKLDVVEKIGESRSAKNEWTREGFNKMIKLCKAGKIDYVVIDEPKRLSRNNLDTSRIIDLMDKKFIKWILWSSREYKSDNSRDKFLLQLDLSLSKMDNEDRSKDVKEKMETCINNTNRYLGKAPYWYKNITIKKWLKDIIIDEKEAEIVKEIYNLRLENKAYSTICNILEEKYWDNINLSLNPSRLQKLVISKFYHWIFLWAWKERIWNHKTIITKELYDKVNKVWKWVYQKIDKEKRESRKYLLKGFVKDTNKILLTSYIKKNNTYYWNQNHSDVKICINENLLFDKIWEYIKNSEKENKILTSIDKDIILDLLNREKLNEWNEFLNIDVKIKNIKLKQEKLLDMKLEDLLDDDKYLEKNNKFENEIVELKEQKNSIENDDFEEKTKQMLELGGSLYRTYIWLDNESKLEVIKKLMLELCLNTKKELQIEDTPLFKSSKMLNFYYGNPTENWTPVTALRRQSPNH